MEVPLIVALISLIGVVATLAFNAWRAYREASWARVTKALDMIASGEDRQETIGWAMLDHQMDDRSISDKDAAMIETLSVTLGRDEYEEDQASATLDENEKGELQ